MDILEDLLYKKNSVRLIEIFSAVVEKEPKAILCLIGDGELKKEIMDKIKKLQQILTLNQIDAYIIPTADEHNSEYISAYYKIREYLTGFTGSAGTLIITQNKDFPMDRWSLSYSSN